MSLEVTRGHRRDLDHRDSSRGDLERHYHNRRDAERREYGRTLGRRQENRIEMLPSLRHTLRSFIKEQPIIDLSSLDHRTGNPDPEPIEGLDQHDVIKDGIPRVQGATLLDESQLQALHRAITTELAIIQGPCLLETNSFTICLLDVIDKFGYRQEICLVGIPQDSGCASA
ncbi:hypothetical protein QBC38DRAFT_479405 [Podospora fimiseda]|uniref:Uncharacterized protein n=1 Tax=Podospora fimiseda TaxID=252190 RepID=A0AAN7BP06_9PEZI|nr:hypothetical protein QBC38DRAFT_479405 [Podospora fimiseda]